MKAKTVKKWFNVHKWTSLICTVFLLMLCLTGLPLIFYEEIDHLLGKELELPVPSPGTPELSKDVVLEEALKNVPVKALKYVSWDVKEHPGQMFVVVADSSEAPIAGDHYLTMNEYTGKVMDTPPNEMDFMLVMYYLHVEMLAGIPGKLFLGLMGLLFVVSIVSGAVLYGPIMKHFNFGMIRTEKSPRLKWLDLHNLLGIVTLAWASVVGLTGVINTLVDPALDRWKASQLAEMVAGYKDQPKVAGILSSLHEAVNTAKAAAPGMDVSFVAYPGTLYSSKYHYAVYLTGTSPLTSRIIKPALIDAKTGELTDIRDLPWYLKTIFISQPFHFGDYGGIPMKILWAIFDLATIIVLISGIYLWLARRRAWSAQLKRITGESESLTLSSVQEDAEKK